MSERPLPDPDLPAPAPAVDEAVQTFSSEALERTASAHVPSAPPETVPSETVPSETVPPETAPEPQVPPARASVVSAASGPVAERPVAERPVAERPVLLSARGLTKSYKMGSARLEVLRGVDLDVRQGEILAVLGKSGCGKSTLLHVLGWLDKADTGEIRYEGQDRNGLSATERARQRNRVMGFVFQFYHLMPELTALENVLVPARIRHDSGGWRANRHAATERARALLAMVGLGARMGHHPSQLSGGERQRVAIARALENQPKFLLCDEPTGNLDGRTAEDVRALLWGLNRTHGQTMVIVTHDARLAAEAHRVVHIADGRIVAGATPDAFVPVLPSEALTTAPTTLPTA